MSLLGAIACNRLKSEEKNTLKKIVGEYRHYFVHAGVFSFFINLLMLALPFYTMALYDRVLTSRSNETLLMLFIVATFALLIMAVLDTLRARILLGAGIALDNRIGPLVIEGLLRRGSQPVTAANPFTAGLRDVATLRSFLTGQSIIGIYDTPWAPVFIVVIFMFHPLLGWASVVAGIMLFLLGVLNQKLTRRPLQVMGKQTALASRFIDSSLRNAEVISALGMGGRTIRRWQELNDEVINGQLSASLRGGVIGGITKFLRIMVTVVIMGLGAYLVIDVHISAGVMMATTLLLSRALGPLEHTITTWKNSVDAREAWRRLQELLSQPASTMAAVDVPVVDGRLEVERATFAVPGTDRMILKGLQFSLGAGESLGIIGPSASGKSTLA